MRSALSFFIMCTIIVVFSVMFFKVVASQHAMEQSITN